MNAIRIGDIKASAALEFVRTCLLSFANSKENIGMLREGKSFFLFSNTL